ncbi:MAG: hypothetical protein Q7R96_06395 [Nanoarchaeota archaeon]|nr:hypothetical protein [Nanoarchaeota archaeon]
MNTIKFTINFHKKHFYLLVLTLALILGILYVQATTTTKPNPGHSLDELEGVSDALEDYDTRITGLEEATIQWDDVQDKPSVFGCNQPTFYRSGTAVGDQLTDGKLNGGYTRIPVPSGCKNGACIIIAKRFDTQENNGVVDSVKSLTYTQISATGEGDQGTTTSTKDRWQTFGVSAGLSSQTGINGDATGTNIAWWNVQGTAPYLALVDDHKLSTYAETGTDPTNDLAAGKGYSPDYWMIKDTNARYDLQLVICTLG